MLCNCADYALTGARTPKLSPWAGKVPVEAAAIVGGRDRGIVGWLGLSQRPVDRSLWRQLAAPTARRAVRAISIALGCGLLAGCGGEPILAPPVKPSPQTISTAPGQAAATPIATAMAPQIGDIVWAAATDQATNAPIDPVSSYRPDALRIVAALHIDALSAGSSLEATWEYNDTSLDAFTTRLAPADSGADQWVSFYIERNPEVEWPVGTYEVKISLNGATVQQGAVEVRQES